MILSYLKTDRNAYLKVPEQLLALQESAQIAIPRQRALIFQGGGALGAYEAGVYRVLSDWIFKNIVSRNKNHENLFDVIAGTSIGAINGAIIMSHYLEKKNQDTTKSFSMTEYWKGSADKLEQFWHEIETKEHVFTGWFDSIFWPWDLYRKTSIAMKEAWNTMLDKSKDLVTSNLKNEKNQLIEDWFEFLHFITEAWDVPASTKSARRYWTTRMFGSPNVAAWVPRWDFKFWDNPMGFRLRLELSRLPFYWLHPTFSLKESSASYISYPIKTYYANHEPRLLIMAVDVQSGDTVSIDSYGNKTEYDEYDEEGKHQRADKEEHNHHLISYPKGIEWDQLKTTFSMPGLHRYALLRDEISGNMRTYWDGAVISSTPLRQLIEKHKEYWLHHLEEAKEKGQEGEPHHGKEKGIRKKRTKIPPIDIYIADVWPSKSSEYPVPSDNDFAASRMTEMMLLDKTEFEESVTKKVTDYIHLVDKLIILLRNKGATDKDIRDVLDLTTKSTLGTNHQKKYIELLDDMVEIERVIRIERKDDLLTMSYSMSDFSSHSISELLEQGKHDALDKLIRFLTHTIENLDKTTIDDDDNKSHNKPVSDVTKNMLHGHLDKAKHLLTQNDNYYEKVMEHLYKFVDEVNTMESDGRLDQYKANLLRP